MAHANEPTKGATDPAAKDPIKVDEINMEGLQDRKTGNPERLHIDPDAAGPVSDGHDSIQGDALIDAQEYAVHAEGLELIITLHDDQLQQVVIQGEAAAIMVAGNYPGWALKLCREYTDESGRTRTKDGRTDKYIMPADDMGLESFDVMNHDIPAAGSAGEYDHYAETEAGAGADEARADAIIATKLIRYLSDRPNLIRTFKAYILEELSPAVADQIDPEALERAAQRIGDELFGGPVFKHLTASAQEGKENPFFDPSVTASVKEMEITKEKMAASMEALGEIKEEVEEATATDEAAEEGQD